MTDDDRDLTTELDRLGRIHARAAVPPPPSGLDETILAQSRAAVRAPRQPRRWWIPASVAATALIALSLVTRIQQEADGRRAATDAATAPQAAVTAGDSGESGAVAPLQPRAATPAADAVPTQEAPAARSVASTGKRSVPARQSVPRQAFAPSQGEVQPADSPPPAEAEPAKALQALPAAAVGAKKPDTAAPPMTAEAWLEKIEALEAAGRTEEAARQRALLEKAYPGWLESRQGPH